MGQVRMDPKVVAEKKASDVNTRGFVNGFTPHNQKWTEMKTVLVQWQRKEKVTDDPKQGDR